jgi:hypothetical protein
VTLPLRKGGPTSGTASTDPDSETDTATDNRTTSPAFDPVDINFQDVVPPVNGSQAMVGTIERAELCGREPLNASMLKNGCVPRTNVAVVWTHVPPYLKVSAGCPPLAPESPCTFGYIASHASSLNSTDPLTDASTSYTDAVRIPIAALEEEHEEGWRQLMDPSTAGGARITIQSTDLKLAQATASSLYGILSSVRAGWMHHGLAPGGLSTGGCTAKLAQLTDMCDYMGHAFTNDCEFMMYPPLAALYPNEARSVVSFRDAGLELAVEKVQCSRVGHDRSSGAISRG